MTTDDKLIIDTTHKHILARCTGRAGFKRQIDELRRMTHHEP